MKRLIPVLSLFLFMCLVGVGASLFLAQNAMAYEDLPLCDGDCTPNILVSYEQTCITGASVGYNCPPEAPYLILKIYSSCSGSGYCSDTEIYACHSDYFGNCD